MHISTKYNKAVRYICQTPDRRNKTIKSDNANGW